MHKCNFKLTSDITLYKYRVFSQFILLFCILSVLSIYINLSKLENRLSFYDNKTPKFSELNKMFVSLPRVTVQWELSCLGLVGSSIILHMWCLLVGWRCFDNLPAWRREKGVREGLTIILRARFRMAHITSAHITLVELSWSCLALRKDEFVLSAHMSA